MFAVERDVWVSLRVGVGIVVGLEFLERVLVYCVDVGGELGAVGAGVVETLVATTTTCIRGRRSMTPRKIMERATMVSYSGLSWR